VAGSWLVVRPITRIGWIIVSGFGKDRNRAQTMHEGIGQSLRAIAEGEQANRSGNG
jgi:hypothetical protein